MIKIIRLCLFISTISLYSSSPSLAMDQEQEVVINRITKKIRKYETKASDLRRLLENFHLRQNNEIIIPVKSIDKQTNFIKRPSKKVSPSKDSDDSIYRHPIFPRKINKKVPQKNTPRKITKNLPPTKSQETIQRINNYNNSDSDSDSDSNDSSDSDDSSDRKSSSSGEWHYRIGSSEDSNNYEDSYDHDIPSPGNMNINQQDHTSPGEGRWGRTIDQETGRMGYYNIEEEEEEERREELSNLGYDPSDD